MNRWRNRCFNDNSVNALWMEWYGITKQSNINNKRYFEESCSHRGNKPINIVFRRCMECRVRSKINDTIFLFYRIEKGMHHWNIIFEKQDTPLLGTPVSDKHTHNAKSTSVFLTSKLNTPKRWKIGIHF